MPASKKLVKALYTFLIIIGVIGLAIFQPWKYLGQLPILGPKSALTVNTTSGKADVYLDDRKVGETPYSAENLNPGDYELRLERVSENSEFYEPISRQIHLEADTRTLVEAEIGPSLQFSSFKTAYYQKNGTGDAAVLVSSTPVGATVWIDDIRNGETPITSESITEGTHLVKIEASGYEAAEIQILTRGGYVLIIETNLMIQPISIEEQS